MINFNLNILFGNIVYSIFPVLLSLLACLLLILLLKLIIFLKYLRSEQILLEITLPNTNNQTPLATEQFLTIFHSLEKQKSWLEMLIGKQKTYSLEIVSSKEKGIRFLIRTRADENNIIKKHIISFLSGVKINQVEDYIIRKDHDSFSKTVSLRLARDYSLPLQEQKHLSQHDPIAHITGQMTKLDKNELIVNRNIILFKQFVLMRNK